MQKIIISLLGLSLIVMTVFADDNPQALRKTEVTPMNPLLHTDDTDDDTTVFHSTFENGMGGWTTQDLTIQTNHWQTDPYNAYQGNSWWCGDSSAGGSGILGYDNFWLQYMDTPILNLTGAVEPILSFKVYWSIESTTTSPPPPPYNGWDGANVWISTNGGATFTVLNPVSPNYTCTSLSSFGTVWGMGPNIAGWANQSNTWLDAQFNLSAYTVNNVKIRFAFASDRAVSSATGHPELLGFFLDNILVTAGTDTFFRNDADNPPTPAPFTYAQGPPFGDWWVMTEATSFSPTHCMVVDDDHFFINNALISPPVALPENYQLWFKYAVLCDLPDSTHGTSTALRDYYFVDISDDGGLIWQQQFYDYARGYCFPRWGICAPDTPYTPGGNIEMDLTQWGGDTIQIRFRCVTDGDHTTGNGSGLHIDDLWVIGDSLLRDDVGTASLHIPFPTTVDFPINCSVEAHNFGSETQNLIPVFFRAGTNTIPLGYWVTALPQTDTLFNFSWTPTIAGEVEPYVYTVFVDDANPDNDTTYAGTVEVNEDEYYELGYDNRDPQFFYVFDTGEGPLVKFEEPFNTLNYWNLFSLRAIFNGDLLAPTSFTAHFYYEGTAINPGPEFRTETCTVDPASTYPNWWSVVIPWNPNNSTYNGDLWLWLEITDPSGFPHPVGHNQVWGEGYYFNYNGLNATVYSNDLMIRTTIHEGEVGVSDNPMTELYQFKLEQNYPNPFNSSTEIRFELPVNGYASLKVYDTLGRLAGMVFEGNLNAGEHKLQIEGKDLSSGLYFTVLEQEGNKMIRKLVLLK